MLFPFLALLKDGSVEHELAQKIHYRIDKEGDTVDLTLFVKGELQALKLKFVNNGDLLYKYEFVENPYV